MCLCVCVCVCLLACTSANISLYNMFVNEEQSYIIVWMYSEGEGKRAKLKLIEGNRRKL